MLDTTIYKAGEKAYTFTEEDFDAWVARRELITEFDAKAELAYIVEMSSPEDLVDNLTTGVAQILEERIPWDQVERIVKCQSEGWAEGAHSKQLEIAQAMLTVGLSADIIAELAQLTLSEITELQEI